MGYAINSDNGVRAVVSAADLSDGETYCEELPMPWPPAPTADEQIKQQIIALEVTVTPRRLREAAIGSDGGWLKALDAEITALRAKLTT